jgi:alginate O-acetyltransferase complex protein AlgI
MLFQSLTFLIFLAILLAAMAVTRGLRTRAVILLIAGWVFYGWWDVRFLPLLWSYTVIGWISGFLLDRRRPEAVRRITFWMSIGLCLVILAYFKYANFFLESFAELLAVTPPRFSIILPIGISFITFEIISYICDVRDGKIEPSRNLLDFALFNGFFPRIISGPIVRPAQFLPQLGDAPRLTRIGLLVGGQAFLVGMFHKVVLADNLSSFGDHIYADPGFYSPGTLWLAVASYSAQIYCDFAGYSLMAIGLARMFGLRLPRNFNYPYLSRSVTEFWQRWHISLSTWLRDYLYIRLGGNRKGRVRTYVNLMVTMLLGGLWHGAGWNFVLWGGLHGAALAGERALRSRPDTVSADRTWPMALSWGATLLFVSLAWIPFRSPDTATTGQFLAGLVSGGAVGWYPPQVILVLLVLAAIHVHMLRPFSRLRLLPSPHPARLLPAFLLTLLFWSIILFRPLNTSPFIYFQF